MLTPTMIEFDGLGLHRSEDIRELLFERKFAYIEASRGKDLSLRVRVEVDVRTSNALLIECLRSW